MNKTVMTGEKPCEVASARRRLIRGTFAAPAVLALHSGSTFAMSSSLRCVQNQLSPGASAPVGSVVRTQLYGLRPNEGATNNVRWYIRGADVDALRMNKASIQNSFLRGSEWQQFDPSTGKLVGVPGGRPVWNNSQAGYLPENPDGAYVAVRINASSTEASIMGVVDGSSPGAAIAGTCWASVVLSAR